MRRGRGVQHARPLAWSRSVAQDSAMDARFFLAALAFLACNVLAHGGGLNAQGCHNNRKTGEYHCHRAPSVAAIKAAQEAKHPAPQKTAAMPELQGARATPNP